MTEPSQDDQRRPSGSLTNRTITGVLWSGSGTLAYYIVNLATLVILSRMLSPREIGIAAGAALVLAFVNLILDLGVAPALVQRESLTEDHVTTAFYASLALGIALSVICALQAANVASFLHIPELRQAIPFVSLLFVVGGVSTVSRAMAERALLFRRLSQVRVVTDGIVFAVVAIPAAAAGLSYWSVIFAQMAASTVGTVWLFRITRHPLSFRVRWPLLLELCRYGGGISIARLVSYFGREGDNLVVAATFDAASLGLYSRAYRLMVVPATIIGAAMDGVLFPILSRNQADGRRVGEALERGIVAVSLTVIPLGLACCVLAPEIVGVVLGPKWSGAVEPFRILALGMYLRVSYKMAGAVSMSGGAVYRYAAAQFVYAAVVVGGAIAAKGLGLPGVAGVVLIGLVAEFLLLWWLAARVLAFPLSRFLRIHVVAAPLSVVVLVVTMTSATYLRSLGLADMPTLAGTGVATALVVVAATWRLPGVFLGAQGQWWFHRAKVLLLTRHGGS